VPEIDAAAATLAASHQEAYNKEFERAATLAASHQEAYNKEFERAALFDVLMRETPRPDDEATGLLKYTPPGSSAQTTRGCT
jgi:hypothetical protein